MAVPAHDERDFEFAKMYELPIIPTIASKEYYDFTLLMQDENISETKADEIFLKLQKFEEESLIKPFT
jgi:leucyl-tRNA synthetase